MTDLVVDSWAWIEYLEGSELGAKVRDVMRDERNKLHTHIVSIAEIISKEKRRNKDTEIAWKAITNLTKILPMDESDSKAVGLLHAELKSKKKNLGRADSFVLYAARTIGGRVLTGDPDFRGISDVMLLQ